jgi:hypothetical protein
MPVTDHNGGIWPMVGGYWIAALVAALVAAGEQDKGARELVKLARACALDDWAFNEWLHGRSLEPMGMPGQSWNAAAFLMAERAVRDTTPVGLQALAAEESAG